MSESSLGKRHDRRRNQLRKSRRRVVALLTLGVAGTASLASAATVNWSGVTSTDWSVGTNWGGSAPTFADIASFASASYTNQPSLTAPSSVLGISQSGIGAVTIGGSSAL